MDPRVIQNAIGKIKNVANSLFGDTNPNQAGNQNFVTNTAAKVGNYIKQDFNRAPAVQTFNTIKKTAPIAMNFNPESNNGQNFWSTPAARGLGEAQRFVQKPPKVNLQKFSLGIQNPVGRTAAGVGLGVAENFVNLPQRLLESGARLGTNYRTGELRKPGVAIGTAAAVAEPLLDLYTLGGASIAKGILKEGFKQGGKQGLKYAVKRGAIEGGGWGAIFGTLNGLAQGKEAKLGNALQGGATGAFIGGTLGGALGGATGVAGKVSQAILSSVRRNNPRLPEPQVQALAKVYIRDRAGKFAKGKGTQLRAAGLQNNIMDRSQPIQINDWMSKIDQDLGVDQINPQAGFVRLPGGKKNVAGGLGDIPDIKSVAKSSLTPEQEFIIRQRREALTSKMLSLGKNDSDVFRATQQEHSQLTDILRKNNGLKTFGKYDVAQTSKSSQIGQKIRLEQQSQQPISQKVGAEGKVSPSDQIIPQSNKGYVAEQPIGGITPEEVTRVANNLIKNNPGLGKANAEAMARDVISNRPFNVPQQPIPDIAISGGSPNKLKLAGSEQTQPNPRISQSGQLETGGQGGRLRLKTQQSQALQGDQQPGVPTSGGRSDNPSSPAIIPEKAFNINVNRLKATQKGQAKIKSVVKQMEPVLRKNKGKALSDDEVLEGGRKALLLGDVMQRSESKKFAESLQATRNFIKTESKNPGVTPKFLEQLEILSSTAADSGRRLRAFGIDAENTSVKAQVLKEMLKLEVDTKDILKAAKSVDWNNADDVTRFYRQFKPATLLEKLEEYRYVNMLSSPNTQIVNNFSNFIQTGLLAPVEKTVAGQIDWVANKLTGRERQYFASQGTDYAKGYYSALPKAVSEFKKVMAGASGLTKPDIDFLPTSTSRLQKAYTTPLRALEASDKFFRTLAEAGETRSLQKSNLSPAQIAKKARDTAEYRVFRQQFDPDGKLGQNIVLQTWDKWNSSISNLRRVPGGRWIVPFLQTPTNILKQGVEYSPLGFSTVPGSKEPIVQLSKALIGTSVFSAAYGVADAGLTTWDTPINKKEKDAFYAAGLQPYSVKIGDKWVSYSKLGPLSYPIAMASAMKWAKDNGADNDLMGTIGAGMGGTMQFFADQSYVRGIGDYIDALRGDDYKIQRAFSNIPAQLVPYRSFLGWVTRMVDPVYRKVDGVTSAITTQIPGLSTMSEPYKTPFGEDSPRDFPILNSFSPLRVTQEKERGVNLYNQLNSAGKVRLKVKAGQKADEVTQSGDSIVWVNSNGITQTVDLQPKANTAQAGTLASYEEGDDNASKAIKIWKAPVEQVSNEKKIAAYKQLGFEPDDVRYAYKASFDTDTKVKYIASKNLEHDKLIDELIKGRNESVGGKRFAADGVLDELYKQNLISSAERTALKKIKTDSKGKGQAGGGGSGKGLKVKKAKKPKFTRRSVPKLRAAKPKKLKTKRVKLAQIKLDSPRGAENAGKVKLKI